MSEPKTDFTRSSAHNYASNPETNANLHFDPAKDEKVREQLKALTITQEMQLIKSDPNFDAEAYLSARLAQSDDEDASIRQEKVGQVLKNGNLLARPSEDWYTQALAFVVTPQYWSGLEHKVYKEMLPKQSLYQNEKQFRMAIEDEAHARLDKMIADLQTAGVAQRARARTERELLAQKGAKRRAKS